MFDGGLRFFIDVKLLFSYTSSSEKQVLIKQCLSDVIVLFTEMANKDLVTIKF